MNYAAVIENRRSVRAFLDRQVPGKVLKDLQAYYETGCLRLEKGISTELLILSREEARGLETAAGYEQALVGAPHYLILLSEKQEKAGMNAGFLMEDLLLKLEDMDLQSCWISFQEGDRVKEALGIRSDRTVAAIAAFGYGEKQQKKLRLNILSMSCVDTIALRGYYAPKKDIRDLAFVNELDNIQGLDEKIGFYEDMLWQSLYAASKAPSYLNRQPYAFLMKDQDLMLVSLQDAYTDPYSMELDLGIVLLHFTAVARQWQGNLSWDLQRKPDVVLPAGCHVAAVTQL